MSATEQPAAEKVLTEQRGHVLVMTLNRPESRNAIDRDTAVALAAAINRLDEDPELRVGILAASGPAFCAGMDLKAFLRGERPTTDRGFAGMTKIPPDKPLIAAVEGAAAGGGFELVLACDMIVASTNAKFGLPEVKRGLVAAGGGVLRLPHRVSHTTAMEWILTGEFVDAQTAFDKQLVNRLVEPGEALDAALQLAELVAANGPLAVAACKAIVSAAADWPSTEAYELQREFTEPVRSSEDAREGAAAFLERRSPQWSGR